MSRSALAAAALSLASALALPAAAGADVTVTRPAAEPGVPSPAARTCELQFRRHTPVWSSCEQNCYVESWDGPLLMAANTCDYTVWASFVFSAEDGRTWRSPCYELEPGAPAVAVPEETLGPWADRRVVIAQEPGTRGYVHHAPSPDCPAMREVQPSTTP
jgi:hypothetical protein